MSTKLMQADIIANDFNATADNAGWSAHIGGTRALPTVKFAPGAGMVDFTFYPETQQFSFTFRKVTCAWGDYMSAVKRGIGTILSILKACGYDLGAPLEDADGVLRLEYDAATKQTYAHLARVSDNWMEYAEISFKELPPVL